MYTTHDVCVHVCVCHTCAMMHLGILRISIEKVGRNEMKAA